MSSYLEPGIAWWEKNINDAYAAQGMDPAYKASDPMSPFEASGGDHGTYLQLMQQAGAIPMDYGTGAPQTAPQGTPQAGYGGGASPAFNPNMQGQVDYLRQQSDFALGQNLNGIRSNAVGVGGLGGDRFKIAQGVATGLANQGYTGAVSNMLGQDWTNQQNRDLQNRGLDVTMRGQDIGWQNQTNQYGLQRDALDSQLVTNGINQSWAPIINAGNLYSQLGGGSVTNSTNTGGGWQGLLGGALGGAQLAKAWGV